MNALKSRNFYVILVSWHTLNLKFKINIFLLVKYRTNSLSNKPTLLQRCLFERSNLKWFKYCICDSPYFCLMLLLCCHTFSLHDCEKQILLQRYAYLFWNTLNTRRSNWPFACLPIWRFPFFILEANMHWQQWACEEIA